MLLLIALAPCGGSTHDESKTTASVVPPAQPAEKPPRPAPTKEQRAAYKQHMKAAQALEKDKKWAEAVTELEAALTAIEGDQRALAELGFAAMNAGDYVKARKADDEAVRVAADKKVKAASLYNLGLVQEKTGDLEGARASFTASLALRPNRAVSDELSGLGGKIGPPPPFCAAGAKPCDCIGKHAFGQIAKDAPPTCTLDREAKLPPLPGFHLYRIEWYRQTWRYLLDENDQLVAVIDGSVDMHRSSETLVLEKAELKPVGGHKVLWLQTHDEASDASESGDDIVNDDSTTTTAVTLCVIGDGKTRCPLASVPIALSATSERTSLDDSGSPGKTDTSMVETTLDLSLADDGTATLKLLKGASDPQVDKWIGPHKLW